MFEVVFVGELQGAFALAAFKALHFRQRFCSEHGADVVVDSQPERAEGAVFGERAVMLAAGALDQLRRAFYRFDDFQRGDALRRARELVAAMRATDGFEDALLGQAF